MQGALVQLVQESRREHGAEQELLAVFLAPDSSVSEDPVLTPCFSLHCFSWFQAHLSMESQLSQVCRLEHCSLASDSRHWLMSLTILTSFL